MSFDNHYPKRKDHRRVYYGAKAVDRSCRNHGDCPHCLSSRLIRALRWGLTKRYRYESE